MTALGSGDFKVTPNTMGYSALSAASGAAPYFGTALNTGTQITGSALEQSTTDMAGQLTNLMVYQQAYAANSKLIIHERSDAGGPVPTGDVVQLVLPESAFGYTMTPASEARKIL